MNTSRNIFTDQYLGLTSITDSPSSQPFFPTRHQKDVRLEKIKHTATTMISLDLDYIHELVQNVTTLELYKKVLLRFMEQNKDSAVSSANIGVHFQHLCNLCHHFKTPDIAVDVFKSEHYKQFMKVDRRQASQNHLVIMNMLFQSNRFADLLQLYEDLEISTSQNTQGKSIYFQLYPLLTLVLLSIVKQNKTDPFSQATVTLERSFQHSIEIPLEFLSTVDDGRLMNAYAWTACMQEKYVEAFEVAHLRSKVVNRSLDTNIKLFSLLKISRIHEALDVLTNVAEKSNFVDKSDEEKPTICKSIVHELVNEVKASDEEELVVSLKTIFKKLDYVAYITDKTIEDLLLLPVEYRHHRRRKVHKKLTDIQQLYRRYSG